MSNMNKINNRQKQILADFMAEHSDLARNKLINCPLARAVSQRLWEQLSGKLNSAGPPIKTVALWRKVFADQKHSVKKKLSFNKSSKQQTGGGPYEEKVLTAAEELISQASGLTTAVEGLSTVKVSGSTGAEDIEFDDVLWLHDEENDNAEENDNVQDSSAPRKAKGKKQSNEDKCSLLRENMNASIKWRTEKSEKIDRLIKLKEKSCNYQKDHLKKLDKIIRLKEKSFKIKEAEHKISMEIKTLELEALRRNM